MIKKKTCDYLFQCKIKYFGIVHASSFVKISQFKMLYLWICQYCINRQLWLSENANVCDDLKKKTVHVL